MAQYIGASIDEDEEDDGQPEAYPSIIDGPPKPETTLQGRAQMNAEDTSDSGSGQASTQPLDPKFAEFISRSLAGQNSTPKEPDELTSSPEYQQFLQKEGALADFRQAQVQASTMANLGQAFAQAAQGANAPSSSSDLYKNIGQQGQLISKEMENEENRRQNVIKAIENRKGREDIGKLRIQAQKDAADAKKNTELDKNYTKLTHDLVTFKGNPAAQQAALKVQNADTALAIVKDKDPNSLTTQDLHLLAEEMGKIASGGVPTESGIKALMPSNLQTKLAEMQNFLTSKPTDAQAAEYIKHNMQYLDEMKNVAQTTIKDYQMSILKGYKNRVKSEDYDEAMRDKQLGQYASQAAPKTQGSSAEDIKTVDGVKYKKVPGGWEEVL